MKSGVCLAIPLSLILGVATTQPAYLMAQTSDLNPEYTKSFTLPEATILRLVLEKMESYGGKEHNFDRVVLDKYKDYYRVTFISTFQTSDAYGVLPGLPPSIEIYVSTADYSVLSVGVAR